MQIYVLCDCFRSLIGAFIIILGLYCVLWGKSKDNYMKGKSASQNTSLDDHQAIVVISTTNKPVTVPITSEKNSPYARDN